jgi:hypothetical protein
MNWMDQITGLNQSIKHAECGKLKEKLSRRQRIGVSTFPVTSQENQTFDSIRMYIV